MTGFDFIFKPPNVSALEESRNVKKLISALKYENDWRIRYDAALALGHIADPAGAAPLITLLKKEKEISVKVSCIQALGMIKDKKAVDILISLIETSDDEIKAISEGRKSVMLAAIDALGEIASTQAVPALIRLYEHTKSFKTPELDLHAATALGKIGSEEALEFLKARLSLLATYIKNWTLIPSDINFSGNPFYSLESAAIIDALVKRCESSCVDLILQGLEMTEIVEYELRDLSPLPFGHVESRKSPQAPIIKASVEEYLNRCSDSIPEDALRKIAIMKDMTFKLHYPSYNVPGGDAWGERADEEVPEKDVAQTISCEAIRERARQILKSRL